MPLIPHHAHESAIRYFAHCEGQPIESKHSLNCALTRIVPCSADTAV